MPLTQIFLSDLGCLAPEQLSGLFKVVNIYNVNPGLINPEKWIIKEGTPKSDECPFKMGPPQLNNHGVY